MTAFTDGSLSKSEGKEESQMGVGWLVWNDEGTQTEHSKIAFCCGLKEWLSSTRAELGAIWMLLLVAPKGTHIQIYTDSLAAIQAIKKTEKTKKLISCLKMQNASLLWQINRVIKLNELEVKFHKVKGHSGIAGNEEADRLAKKGAKSSTCLTIK